MSIDRGTFETLIPSRFITFTLPNPNLNPSDHIHLHTSLLRIAVLDSPIQHPPPPLTAAMIVPNNRESDWTFSTEHGHLQLLLSFPHRFSRLILIGNNLPFSPMDPLSYTLPCSTTFIPVHLKILEQNLTPLVTALCPKSAFVNGLPDVPFLTYDNDNVICRLVLEICVGDFVGEMLIEDIEIGILDTGTGNKCTGHREFRRRLRFKRMPNLIQTQLRVLPCKSVEGSSGGGGLDLVGLMEEEGIEFQPDTWVLVHPYLTPMVAGLSLIASYLDERVRCGYSLRALCLGVGGGALVSFLNSRLGFEVVGVEVDEVVVRVAKQYFGLKDDEFVRLIIGDGIKLLEKLGFQGTKHNLSDPNVVNDRHPANVDGFDNKFDVIMVDLDSGDARMGVSAPPLEFVRKPVFEAAKFVLHEGGILVINVIPPDLLFYETLVQELHDVFQGLYGIDVGNEENIVLIATASAIGTTTSDHESSFLAKLRSVISGAYMESVMKI